VSPRAGLEDMKRKFLTLPRLELRFSVVQPVASIACMVKVKVKISLLQAMEAHRAVRG
jgi:hypothetical protein